MKPSWKELTCLMIFIKSGRSFLRSLELFSTVFDINMFGLHYDNIRTNISDDWNIRHFSCSLISNNWILKYNCKFLIKRHSTFKKTCPYSYIFFLCAFTKTSTPYPKCVNLMLCECIYTLMCIEYINIPSAMREWICFVKWNFKRIFAKLCHQTAYSFIEMIVNHIKTTSSKHIRVW